MLRWTFRFEGGRNCQKRLFSLMTEYGEIRSDNQKLKRTEIEWHRPGKIWEKPGAVGEEGGAQDGDNHCSDDQDWDGIISLRIWSENRELRRWLLSLLRWPGQKLRKSEKSKNWEKLKKTDTGWLRSSLRWPGSKLRKFENQELEELETSQDGGDHCSDDPC